MRGVGRGAWSVRREEFAQGTVRRGQEADPGL